MCESEFFKIRKSEGFLMAKDCELYPGLSSRYFLAFFFFFPYLQLLQPGLTEKKYLQDFFSHSSLFLTNIARKPLCQMIIEGVNSEKQENHSELITQLDDRDVSMVDTPVCQNKV